MRPEAYSAILYALAEGIHPVTGDFLPDCLIDQPDVIRALFAGARALEAGNQDVRTAKPAAEMPEPAAGIPVAANPEPAGDREPAAAKPDAETPESGTKKPAPKPGRENAGKPWSKEDDALLMESYAAGTSVNSLAKSFKRSAFAIETRLEKLESGQPGSQRRAYRIISASGALDAPVDAAPALASHKTPEGPQNPAR